MMLRKTKRPVGKSFEMSADCVYSANEKRFEFPLIEFQRQFLKLFIYRAVRSVGQRMYTEYKHGQCHYLQKKKNAIYCILQ